MFVGETGSGGGWRICWLGRSKGNRLFRQGSRDGGRTVKGGWWEWYGGGVIAWPVCCTVLAVSFLPPEPGIVVLQITVLARAQVMGMDVPLH